MKKNRSRQKALVEKKAIIKPLKNRSKLAPIRLQKFLANMGLGSRREVERAIEAGEIKVNQQTAKLGAQIRVADKIQWGRNNITVAEKFAQAPRVLMYNKPEGEICTRSDPEGRKTVFQSLPRLKDGRWINIGRLDINTSGLLLFTDDGALANQLMHPSNEIKRYYASRILGEVTPEHIEAMQAGVELEDGVSRFESVEDVGGEGANHWYKVALIGGKNREVRRLWESQGVMVSRLIRIQFGDVGLPENLPQGHFAEIEESNVKRLFDIDLPPSDYIGLYDSRRGRRTDSRGKPNKRNSKFKRR